MCPYVLKAITRATIEFHSHLQLPTAFTISQPTAFNCLCFVDQKFAVIEEEVNTLKITLYIVKPFPNLRKFYNASPSSGKIQSKPIGQSKRKIGFYLRPHRSAPIEPG